MCKHIAAVMYGIGARLDMQPELLFLLRGVDHEDIISTAAATDAIAGTGTRRTRRRTLSEKNLENVFGVELDEPLDAGPIAPPERRPGERAPKAMKPAAKAPKPRAKKQAAFKPTARSIAALRQRLGLSKAAFGREVGVSTATVTNWEKAVGAIRLQAKGLSGLTRLHSQSG